MCVVVQKCGDKDSVLYECLTHTFLITHCTCVCMTPCSPCRVWDIQTGQVINNLLHNRAVRSLKFTTDTLVTAGFHVSGCNTATITCSINYHFDCIVEANRFSY